jgi:hypothetical protein
MTPPAATAPQPPGGTRVSATIRPTVSGMDAAILRDPVTVVPGRRQGVGR